MDTTAPLPFSSMRAYLLEARYEFLRLLRTPSFSLPCLLFPPVFYLLFGVLLGGKGGPVAAQYMLAGYGVFGVIGVALFGFGVTVAMDREQGLLTLKRAQPMPPAAMSGMDASASERCRVDPASIAKAEKSIPKTTPTPPKAGTPTTPRRKRRAYTPNFMRD